MLHSMTARGENRNYLGGGGGGRFSGNATNGRRVRSRVRSVVGYQAGTQRCFNVVLRLILGRYFQCCENNPFLTLFQRPISTLIRFNQIECLFNIEVRRCFNVVLTCIFLLGKARIGMLISDLDFLYTNVYILL